ncbi:MAG: phosphoenolpyruvate mutase [Melioribacteraceae bacterium]|nr:phosphoenolpyruvate mutase [Melioribacteraceae bacterium]
MKKTTQLKKLLTSPDLEFIMEAHNGLSAKIAEEAGFKGIWGSGLSISASLGVRDNNEASWTQVLEVVEYMSDATTVPILLDGDTGYGNFNNMRRLVKKLEQRNIAGVCIEDKLFPKTNSFIRGDKQPLADIEEFAGKIKAGKDSQLDDDFCIVARVEALIAGWGLSEALKRAEAYRLAGADAILMHSKISKPDEILAFMKEWGNRCPVVIVPTKYYSTPTQVFRDAKISLVIWANHQLRSAITAMKETVQKIYTSQSLIEVEDKVAPLAEVFRLQNDDELQQAENIYLKTPEHEKISGIILAASRGAELGELTEHLPKSMININGQPLVKKMLELFNERGIKDISIVRGYKKEAFTFPNINYFDNDDYATTGELVSLYKAQAKISGTCIITYGDILFRKFILSSLLDENGDIVVVADANLERRCCGNHGDFIISTRSYSKEFSEEPVYLKQIQFAELKKPDQYDGEWIGLIKTTQKGSDVLKSTLQEMSLKENFNKMKMPDLLNVLIEKGSRINVVYIDGHWLDVDNLNDLGNVMAYH